MINKITPGYSGKSLSQKLGLKPGLSAISIFEPSDYKKWLGTDASIVKKGVLPPWDFVHVFTNKRTELEKELHMLRSNIKADGIIWVSYFKKSSGLKTEITEDLVRETCFPHGFVDIKVCTVSDEWSGLKLVIRKNLR